jgi:hypothetical protein
MKRLQRVRRRTSLLMSNSERSWVEPLEKRLMLAGYFDNIANTVSGPMGAMRAITTTLQNTGDVGSRIPLINKPARQLTEFTSQLESFRVQLDNTLRSLNEGAAADVIQATLFQAIGPGGANVLGDRDGNTVVNSSDIAVTVNGTDVDMIFNVAKSASFNREFGLGLDAVPFKPAVAEQGGFTFGFEYRNFNFGTSGGSPYFRTNATDEIVFRLDGNLPSAPFTAGLGFLNVTAKDATPGVRDLSVTLRGDITPGYALSNFRIDGSLNLLLNIEASLSNPGLPRIKTDFRFDWNFPTVSLGGGAGGGASASFGVPSINLQNVQMNLGSVLSSIASPIAKRVQLITAPFQPIFNWTRKPIPGLNDLSQSFGGPEVTPLFLSNVYSALPPEVQPESLRTLNNIIEMSEKLRRISETINNLSGPAGNDAWLSLGSFPISGPAGSPLLNAAASTLGNLVNVDWSQLEAVISGGSVNFDAIKAQTISLLGPTVGNEVNNLWTALEGISVGNGVTFDYPIIEDPAKVAVGLLLGKDNDLVSLTARYTIGLDKVYNLVPVPGVVVGVGAVAQFNAYARIGYDTRGLREAISPLYGGGSFDPSKLLRGLYIDKDTKAVATGRITLALGVGIPSVVTATVEGGLEANLFANIGNPLNQDKIRPFVPGHLSNYLFTAGGTIDARAFFRFRAGFSVLGEFIGVDITKDFASVRLLDFNVGGVDGGNIPIPQELTEASIPPAVLGLKTGSHLELFVGNLANQRGSANPTETREHFQISRVYNRQQVGSIFLTTPADTIEVRAFGFVQRFSGIRTLNASFGSGDDVVTIADDKVGNLFPIRYTIDGGDNNDSISMEGSANVTLRGGNGNDTLEGGLGVNSIEVYGDAGFDKLSIAKGRLDLLALTVDQVVVSGGADGGEFLLDNSFQTDPFNPLRPRWTYYFTPPPVYTNLNTSTWILTAGPTGSSNGNDFKFIRFSSVNLGLTAGPGNDTFSGVSPPNATIYGGDGDDDYFLADANASTRLVQINHSFFYYPGNGYDRLLVYNQGSNSNAQPITLDNGKVTWGSGGMIGTMNLGMGDLEQSFITQNTLSPVNVAGWSDKPVRVEGGSQLILATGWTGWNAQITAVNTGGFVVLDRQHFSPYNQVGADELGLYRLGDFEKIPDPNNPSQFIDGPNRVRMYLLYAPNTSFITLDGRSTPNILDVSARLADIGRPFIVNYLGKPLAGNQLFFTDPTDTPRNYVLDSENQFVLGSLTINHVNLDLITFQGGGGDDTFNVTRVKPGLAATLKGGPGNDTALVGTLAKPVGQFLGGGVFFEGEAGVDLIQTDDRGNTSAQARYELANYYVVIDNESGIGVDPRSTESRRLLGTEQRGTVYTILEGNGGWTVDAGPFNDTFAVYGQFALINEDGSDQTLLNGGFGNDVLQLRNAEELGHSPTSIYNNYIDFGTGGRIDYTGVDDLRWFSTLAPTENTSVINFISAPAGASVAFYGRPQTAEILNFGSPTRNAQWAGPLVIDLQGGPFPANDQFNLYTPDLGVSSTWTVLNDAILRDGSNYVTFSGPKEVGLFTGPGSDTVHIPKTNFILNSVSVSTGGGTNTVHIGDGFSDLTGIPLQLNLNGDGGILAVHYNAQATTGIDETFEFSSAGITHTARAPFVGSVIVTRTITQLFANEVSRFELNTSALHSNISLRSSLTSSMGLQTINSGGNDTLNLGQDYGAAIQTPVLFNGSLINDVINVNLLYTDNATTHIGPDGFNQKPGDNLIGSYLAAYSYNQFNFNLGKNVTVFARPSYYGQVSINAQVAPGVSNRLRVATADTTNPLYTPDLATPNTGIWSFDAPYDTISVVGFDDVQGDDTRPALVPALSKYDVDAAKPQVKLTFSEQMIGGLYTPGFVLTNRLTGEVVNPALLEFDTTDPSTVLIRYKQGGNTVPLPDGRYRLTVASTSYADSAGNIGAAEFTFDFFVMAGDANRDARVDFADLVILARNFNRTGKVFSEGDFNYDGTVSFADLVILARNFNRSLPQPPSPILDGGDSLRDKGSDLLA